MRHPMLRTIAFESRTLEEYARRATAYASSERKPPSRRDVVNAWMQHGREQLSMLRGAKATIARTRIHSALDAALRTQTQQREQLWGSLARDINNAEDE